MPSPVLGPALYRLITLVLTTLGTYSTCLLWYLLTLHLLQDNFILVLTDISAPPLTSNISPKSNTFFTVSFPLQIPHLPASSCDQPVSFLQTFLVFKLTRLLIQTTLHYTTFHKHSIGSSLPQTPVIQSTWPRIINLVLVLRIRVNTYTEEQQQGDSFVKTKKYGRRKSKPNLISFEILKRHGEWLTWWVVNGLTGIINQENSY